MGEKLTGEARRLDDQNAMSKLDSGSKIIGRDAKGSLICEWTSQGSNPTTMRAVWESENNNWGWGSSFGDKQWPTPVP